MDKTDRRYINQFKKTFISMRRSILLFHWTPALLFKTPIVAKFITFNGQPITQKTLDDQLALYGAFRVRGGSSAEDPAISGKMGFISREDITTPNDVLLHVEERAISISTTHDKKVAQQFARENGNSREPGVLHYFCHWLIPDSDKTYVPASPQICASYQKEQETVFHNSVPAEVYLGWTPLSPSLFTPLCALKVNPLFLDPMIVMSDKTLYELYISYIYEPYKHDIGPKLGGRKIQITDQHLATFEKGKAEFHERYKAACRFFVAQETKSPFVQTYLNLLT